MKIMDNSMRQKLEKQIQDVVHLYTARNFFKAELQAQKLIKDNPNVVFLHNLIGLILYEQGKLDQALTSYNTGLNITPNYHVIHNNLGTVYKAKNNFLKAEECYKKAIKLNNNFYEAHNNLGNLYIEINNHKNAINSFKNSIVLNLCVCGPVCFGPGNSFVTLATGQKEYQIPHFVQLSIVSKISF